MGSWLRQEKTERAQFPSFAGQPQDTAKWEDLTEHNMDYVVLDLEFNNMQGLYDNMSDYMSRENRNMRYLYPNEIIQIGAVKVSESFEVLDELNIFVKNSFYKNLNPAIAEMTGIDQGMIDSGRPYPEAVGELVEFGKDSIIITWGISDIYELIRNCHMHAMPITIVGKRYLDLQAYLGDLMGENKIPSLKNAMLAFGLGHDEDKFHDGLYDSICTAEVLREVVQKYGPLDGLKNCKILFTSESIYITNIKVKDIPDKEVTVDCPLCTSQVSYDLSMSNEHGKIRSMYHCQACRSYFFEDISVKENMMGERKYFKKIKKIPKDYFDFLSRQRQSARKY